MKIKTLICGLGQIGMGYDLNLDNNQFILTHARSVSLNPKFDLIAGIDIDKKRREIFSKHYKRPAYEDISEFSGFDSIDFLIISSSTSNHKKVFDDAIKIIKPKIILCEKPLSYDLDESKAMVDICRDMKIKLFVNYMRRSDPGAIKLKEIIDCEYSEFLFKGIAWYSKGFFNNASHLLNLLEFWFGDVKSFQIIKAGRFWDASDPEPDVLIEFQNAQIIFLSCWEEHFSHYTIELLCSKGRVRYEYGGEIIQMQDVKFDPNIQGYKILNSEIKCIKSDMFHYQQNVLKQIEKAYCNESYSLCSGDEALNTLKSIHEIVKLRQN